MLLRGERSERAPKSRLAERRLGSEPVGDAQRVGLEQLDSRLLRQHDVAGHQAALREEAPAAHAPAIAVDLLDVHLPAVANAVALAGLAAGDVEISVFLVLLALGSAEVLHQQPNAALLRSLAADVGTETGAEQGVARAVVTLLGPPVAQPVLRLAAKMGRVRLLARRLGLANRIPRGAPGPAPEPIEQGCRHAPAFARAADLGQVLRAHARVNLLRLAKQGAAEAGQIPRRIPLADRVAVGGPHGRPGAVTVGEIGAEPGLEASGRSFDEDIAERRRLLPMLAEGPTEQDPQEVANPLHQPPCSCGMNKVCSTCGSNLPTSLPGLPSPLSATARKPLPVSCRKRSSARATASESATSNSCLVSPVRSITIWTAIFALLLTLRGGSVNHING